MANALKYNNTLKKLKLGSNEIGLEGMKCLEDALLVNRVSFISFPSANFDCES
ncbi:unnamed protein product, partial [Adineta ricciae]